ncbi:hypothetical protein VNO78_20689 [Psophocarpus tetragonolobus]|uniref:Uncharacterized protein n=1 Tax=Psophocarpus tetragonolobus TaxID=3891 RepID=A0AAN9XGZ4_PSOTE
MEAPLRGCRRWVSHDCSIHRQPTWHNPPPQICLHHWPHPCASLFPFYKSLYSALTLFTLEPANNYKHEWLVVAPCCEKVGLKRGRWTAEEDELLAKYIQANGEGQWRSLPKNAGLLRCGKSCRLRWINYLRADLKRGNISAEEENTIVKLHASFGNRLVLPASLIYNLFYLLDHIHKT